MKILLKEIGFIHMNFGTIQNSDSVSDSVPREGFKSFLDQVRNWNSLIPPTLRHPTVKALFPHKKETINGFFGYC